jgi:hypothetical protein
MRVCLARGNSRTYLAHWRNHVDDAIDDPNSEMAKFESRYLELNQLFDGNWYIHGILDHATGVISR